MRIPLDKGLIGWRVALVLTRGLEAAIADGSFEQAFRRYNSRHIEDLHLAKRRVIELPNPLLPDTVPLNRPELWFRP